MSTADASFLGEKAGDYLGRVAGAGDVNNDTYDDFLIASSRSGPGKAYLILGKPLGWSLDQSVALVSNASFFGETPESNIRDMGGAGDINGDGFGGHPQAPVYMHVHE